MSGLPHSVPALESAADLNEKRHYFFAEYCRRARKIYHGIECLFSCQEAYHNFFTTCIIERQKQESAGLSKKFSGGGDSKGKAILDPVAWTKKKCVEDGGEIYCGENWILGWRH